MALREQDYRDAASSLPREYLGGNFITSALDSAEVSAIQVTALFKDNIIQMGQLSGAIGNGMQKRGAALSKSINSAQTAQARKEKQATDDAVYLNLLEQIAALNKDLIKIRANIETLDGELRDEYGDDYLDDMAEMYLSDSERETLEGLSPEERAERTRELLSKKMLNDDGTIKEAYKHLKIAKLLEQMKKEGAIQKRVKKLEEAYESGDPEAMRDAVGNDELTDDAGTNILKEKTADKLKGTFRSAAASGDQSTIEIGNQMEERDVADNANPNTAFSDFDSFSNS